MVVAAAVAAADAPAPEVPRGTGDALSPLGAAVAGVLSEDIDGRSAGALGEDLVTLRVAVDRLEAEFARRLLRFATLRGHEADGQLSVVSWLRRHCRLSGPAAAQRLETARCLGELPAAAAAFRAGRIGFQHAAVLARCVSEVGAQAARSVQHVLLSAAHSLDPGQLRYVTRRLRCSVDPDGALAAAEAAHQQRRLHLSETFDGVFVLDGLLDAEGGAVLRSALEALAQPTAADERSPAQRRADALVELAGRQLRGDPLPSALGRPAQLILTSSLATLRQEPGAAAAELQGAGPVVAATARRLACDALLSPLALDPQGTPLDVGRSRRTIPSRLRTALLSRDRGCRFPGCDRPSHWTDAHHIVHWADGGPTRLDNLVLLCRRHHRLVHEGRWQLSWQADGQLLANPP